MQDSISHLLGYFDYQVLAGYSNQPDKYKVYTDNFEGSVSVVSGISTEDHINIRFGFRALKNGELVIAAWLPDLVNCIDKHKRKWNGYKIDNVDNFEENDERFFLWINRYIEGSWEVDNGPIYKLGETIKYINSISFEMFGNYLFKYTGTETLSYPAAQNTQEYYNSHAKLYGLLIDGLNKEAIKKIICFKNTEVNIESDNTVKALRKCLPTVDSKLWDSLELISSNRRDVAHGIQNKVQYFLGFEQFTKDLILCNDGLSELLIELEKITGITKEKALKRHDAMRTLPNIISEPEPNYSINLIKIAEGKTIEKIEIGEREQISNCHKTEIIIIHFTDKSIVAIDTGSNAENVLSHYDQSASNFSVDFNIKWVPSLK